VTNQQTGQLSALTLNTGVNEDFAGAFTGNLRFVKAGAGAFVATAAPVWDQMQGAIEAVGGKLVVNGVGGTGQITVSNAGVLAGLGTVARSVAVTNGGVLAPGASPGQMTFANALDLSDGGVFQWELGALTTTGFSTVAGGSFRISGFNFDQLVIANGGSIKLGGTSKLEIDVSLLAALGPNVADPFWNSTHSWLAIDLQDGGFNLGDGDFGGSSTRHSRGERSRLPSMPAASSSTSIHRLFPNRRWRFWLPSRCCSSLYERIVAFEGASRISSSRAGLVVRAANERGRISPTGRVYGNVSATWKASAH
jgi:hypothetical protein